MTIPRWRLAIVAGALIVLSAIGGGLVQAGSASSASTTSTGPVPPTTAAAPTEIGSDLPSFVGERLRALRDRFGDRGLGRLRKHLVHGTVTVLDRDGELITLQFDHGTISAIGDGSITIAEAGGSSVTLATTAEARVRKDRKPASLSALAVGDEVVVHSVLDAGSATARWIVVPAHAPASAATDGAS
ncbi:MAG: DUF5666 domain-containing protein [Candidatus Limnocylindrales bacterium]|nr:DUF5666 domain-containing protein [Candidatus Limnocylindrales bacterium]